MRDGGGEGAEAQDMMRGGSNVIHLTILIQGKVILGVAELLWSTGNKHIVIPEEILKAGDLVEQRGDKLAATQHI